MSHEIDPLTPSGALNKARNRIFPGWWTYSHNLEPADQPRYTIRCLTQEDFREASEVKPENIRADIILVENPELGFGSNEDLNHRLVAADSLRNLGTGLTVFGLGVIAAVAETHEVFDEPKELLYVYGAGLAVIGLNAFDYARRLGRDVVIEAERRGLNVVKGILTRNLSNSSE